MSGCASAMPTISCTCTQKGRRLSRTADEGVGVHLQVSWPATYASGQCQDTDCAKVQQQRPLKCTNPKASRPLTLTCRPLAPSSAPASCSGAAPDSLPLPPGPQARPAVTSRPSTVTRCSCTRRPTTLPAARMRPRACRHCADAPLPAQNESPWIWQQYSAPMVE